MALWRDTTSQRALITLAGELSLGGFLLFYVVTPLWHPGGEENSHPVIFTKYAKSELYVAVHFLQFAGFLLALAGLLALLRAVELRGQVALLVGFARATLIATVAVLAVVQAVDGVTLKQAVDAWMSASGPAKAVRFADAETVRWTEQAAQSCFRLLLGVTLILSGAAIARTGVVYRWLGLIAALSGLLYIASGVAVGYSGFEQPGYLVPQLLFTVVFVGVLVAGLRMRESTDTSAS